MMSRMEQWTSVVGSPGYEVSDLGRVRSPRRVLRNIVGTDGYHQVHVPGAAGRFVIKRVHRLVLEAFVGPGGTLYGCHNNGQKTDNRLENLRWDTAQANSDDKELHGTHARWSSRSGARLSILRVIAKFRRAVDQLHSRLDDVERHIG